MAVVLENAVCEQHQFIDCRWFHKMFKRCGYCKRKYRFWLKLLKCKSCNLKCHARCVRKIEKVSGLEARVERMGDQREPVTNETLEPTSEAQDTILELSDQLIAEYTPMICKFVPHETYVERESLDDKLTPEAFPSQALNYLTPKYDPSENATKCELTDKTITQNSTNFILDDKTICRLSFLPGFVEIMKQPYGFKEPTTSVLVPVKTINLIEMIGVQREPDAHSILQLTSRVQITKHEQNEKSNTELSPVTGALVPYQTSFERVRPVVDRTCNPKAPKFVQHKTPALCQCSNEIFNHAVTESSRSSVSTVPITSINDIIDVLHDLIDKANERQPHLALPGFQRSLNECLEVTVYIIHLDSAKPPMPKCHFKKILYSDAEPNALKTWFLKNDIKRLPACVQFRFLAADLMDKLVVLIDKAKMLFTLTVLPNVMKNLFKCIDVVSPMVLNENTVVHEYLPVEMASDKEHSKTRLDSWEPNFLWIDQAVTTLLQDGHADPNDIVAIFHKIFEEAKKLVPNTALLNFMKALKELYNASGTLISVNNSMSKRPVYISENVVANPNSVLPKVLAYDMWALISNIFESAERLIPYLALPSLINTLHELVDALGSLVPEKKK